MANNKTSMFLTLTLVLVLLLTISMAESRPLFAGGFGNATSTPTCDSVTNVVSGDTCSAIAEKFDLTTEFFNSINPNLNCDALFVGQWLCIAGSAN